MPKAYTQETFEKKVNEIHNGTIDVSNFKYVNSITVGEAKCNVCGNVWYPRADVLIRGCGCRKCFNKRYSESKITPYEKVQEKISGATINKETYIDTKHHCEAKCNACGNVWHPNVRDLINGHGCPECSKKIARDKLESVYERRRKPKPKKLSTEELKEKNRKRFLESFLERARKKHGNKFTYDEDTFTTMRKKMRIICPIHGEEWQSPKQHLVTEGCCKCGAKLNAKNRTMPFSEVEKRFKEANIKWSYDKTSYKAYSKPMKFICNKHGEFWKAPIKILNFGNCPLCAKNRPSTTEEFIEKANKVHNFKYSYENTKYINNRTIVEIICPIHGSFHQTPNDHLDGCGCPNCQSSQLENVVENKLIESSIEYMSRKSYSWLLNEETNHCLTLDFYLPKCKIAIECQGIQHFECVEHFGGNDKFEKTKKYDALKKELCHKNGIELIYYLDNEFNKYLKEDDIYFNDVNELIKYVNYPQTKD